MWRRRPAPAQSAHRSCPPLAGRLHGMRWTDGRMVDSSTERNGGFRAHQVSAPHQNTNQAPAAVRGQHGITSRKPTLGAGRVAAAIGAAGGAGVPLGRGLLLGLRLSLHPQVLPRHLLAFLSTRHEPRRRAVDAAAGRAGGPRGAYLARPRGTGGGGAVGQGVQAAATHEPGRLLAHGPGSCPGRPAPALQAAQEVGRRVGA